MAAYKIYKIYWTGEPDFFIDITKQRMCAKIASQRYTAKNNNQGALYRAIRSKPNFKCSIIKYDVCPIGTACDERKAILHDYIERYKPTLN